MILHRDDRLVVVAKPSGVAVHRGWADDDDALLQQVRDLVGAWVWPVHRLDRGASGATVFALDQDAARALGAAFAEARVHKQYLALTRGHPPENWLTSLDRLAALEPEHVVPGHGPPAGAESLTNVRRYIETILELAATPGDHEVPPEYSGWSFAEGFQQNIEALRAR